MKNINMMPSFVDENNQPADIRDAVAALDEASRTPAKQRKGKLPDVVALISSHAFTQGLDADTLRDVVRLVTRKTLLDQTSITTLIKNLYPSQLIPADVVVTIVGALGQGHGKPSAATQNLLVKWLLTVYEIIGDTNAISRLYGVLFGMLDMISIRTSLCHLLSRITRRKHVKPFRIQQLLELSRGLGNEPALQGLLRVYKDYYPDIIIGRANISRNSFPPQPDDDWKQRLLAVQQAAAEAEDAAPEQHKGFKVLRKGAKRSKLSAIPDVQTFYAKETSVTLEGIDTAEDFIEKLDRIEPPGQLISFLADPLLQKYVALKHSAIASRRIDLWLSTCLEEAYNAVSTGGDISAEFSQILEGLRLHTRYTKTLLPIVTTFLKEYLPLWDGQENADAILGLLCYLPLASFQATYTDYIGPAEKALAKQGPESYDKLLRFYTDLLRHWVAQSPHLHATTKDLAVRFESKDTLPLRDLVTHVSRLSLSLLLSTPNSPTSPLQSAILSFYETLSSSSDPISVPIIPAPLHLMYLLGQTASATTLSRICGILGTYKTAFDKHPKELRVYYPEALRDEFNLALVDVHNLVWVPKALQASEGRALGFYCDPALREKLDRYLVGLDREYTVSGAFTLSYNALLVSSAASALASMDLGHHEGLRGPVSLTKLAALGDVMDVKGVWKEYRVRVVGWMADRGCAGFRDFIFSVVKDLK